MMTSYPGSVFQDPKKNKKSRLLVAISIIIIFGIIVLLCAWISQLLLTPPADAVRPDQHIQSPLPKREALVASAGRVSTQVSKAAAAQSVPQTVISTVVPAAPKAQAHALPLLVNDSNPLSSENAPDDLVELATYIPPSLASIKEEGSMGCREAADALIEMLEAAQVDGLTNWQITDAYRSVETQQQIWEKTYQKYRTENGLSENKALQATQRRIAKPGTSEHHTGLAFDVGVAGESFRKTPQCAWLAENCADYGFVVRYTVEKERVTGITAEPWHIRYVGIEHARTMTNNGLCLEEYVEHLKASVK